MFLCYIYHYFTWINIMARQRFRNAYDIKQIIIFKSNKIVQCNAHRFYSTIASLCLYSATHAAHAMCICLQTFTRTISYMFSVWNVVTCLEEKQLNASLLPTGLSQLIYVRHLRLYVRALSVSLQQLISSRQLDK